MSALLDQAAKEARQGNLDLKHQNLPPKAIISSRKLGPDSTEIESDNDIKRYSRRPKQLENWCLADFVSQLELQYPKTSESLEHETEQQENESESENEEANADVIEENKIDITLKNGIRIYQRKTPKVIRYVKYNYKTDSENFYRERLMLFYPWRNELSDLQCGHETFENMYLTVARLLEKKAKQYEGKVIDLEKAIEEAENDCNENDQIAPATQQVEMVDAEIGPTESEQYVHFNPDRPTEHRLYDMSREVGIEARTVELTNHANRISESDYFALIRSLNKKHWIFNDLSKGLTALAPSYWKLLFSFHELTEIMRQKDDLEFAQLLNRLRQNQLTENDFAVLSTRTVSITDPTYRTNVTHLFVENALVDNFNFQYISKLCSQKVKAVDTVCGDLPSSVKTKLLSSLPEKQSDTANLAKEVVLAIGMKYDLTANIEVTDGLTNGSSSARKTIHKSQGDTLQEVVVSLKSKRKGIIPHIHYVALSRVTSLTGLQILNLNQEAIAVAECVRQELHRLMTDATLQLCFKPLYNLSNPNILDDDVIGIAESRLISTDENEDFYVPGFEPPVRLDQKENNFNTRRPHGLVLYYRTDCILLAIHLLNSTFRVSGTQKSPVKLQRISQVPSKRDASQNDVLVKRTSSLNVLRSLDFSCKEQPKETSEQCTLEKFQNLPEKSKVNVVAAVMNKSNSEIVDVRGTFINKCTSIVADNTQQMELTLWKHHIDKVVVGKTYHFTNVSTRFFHTYTLTTTSSTDINDHEDLLDIADYQEESTSTTIT
ncbi:unnamed protein product [Mytilus coruscus]|uniref:Uncharacterized protein n=1 Tax=Mytilus coruscus TaxID=42192 RepID=A0A6J8E9Y0_MYTCO|nr:unnamed protein product [Mytilus coruscus]